MIDILITLWMLIVCTPVLVGMINMGCCCVNNGCPDVCSDQTAGDQVQVTTTGVVAGSCSPCTHYNNTYLCGNLFSGTLDTQCQPATAPCCMYTAFGASIACGGNDRFVRLYRSGSTVGATWEIGYGNLSMAWGTTDTGIGSLPAACENIDGVNLPDLINNSTGCDVSGAVVTLSVI